MDTSINENEVVKAQGITFRYGDAPQPVIDLLDLSLKRSEVLFLIGLSGMGKTTLLKILAGLYSPQTGDVFIQGAPLAMLNSKDRRMILRRVSMTFQRSGLFDSLTVLENLLFPLKELTLFSPEQSLKVAQKILSQVELRGSESKFPFEMSGGMQKRLGIARALVLEPEVVFYDDPTAGLDPITSKHIVELILKVHKEKETATLIATSELDLALGVSRKNLARIAFLHEGRILQIGTAEEILDSNNPVVFQFVRGLLKGPLTRLESE